MRIDGNDHPGEERGQEINIGELSYRKAAQKKRIPDNFDNVVGGKQEEEKSGHESNSCRLARADVKEMPKMVHQRARSHGSSTFSPITAQFLPG
jgi:hypothetical protein